MTAPTFIKRTNMVSPLVLPPRPDRPVTKGNVLLAHDNKEELEILSGYLDDTYELFTARNGGGVMRMIETYPIHLIIANIELSGSDGSRLCAQIKASENYSHIPVILLIAKSTVLSRIKSLESGADAYIEKPLIREFINAQIKNVISNRARIKDYFAHSIFAHLDTTARSKECEFFVNKLNECISGNLPDKNFDVEQLARHMNMSRPTLYRKVKCISDLAPNELINVARLKKAAELISTTDYQILEIAKMTGFSSRGNFGKAFFKYFNVTPTAFRQFRKS